MAPGRDRWLLCCESFTQHFLPLQIKYHEEFEKSRMGPSGGEGIEPERRDAQEQPPHHIPTSAPGEREACGGGGPGSGPAVGWGGGWREPLCACAPARQGHEQSGQGRCRLPACWRRDSPCCRVCNTSRRARTDRRAFKKWGLSKVGGWKRLLGTPCGTVGGSGRDWVWQDSF